MREKQHLQATLFDHYVEHEIGYELKANSMILEQHPEMLDWVKKIFRTEVSQFLSGSNISIC